MKYFIVEQDKKIIDGPQIINWYNKIDVEKINRNEVHKIPNFIELDVKSVDDVTYYDIISFPFFLISELYFEIIQMFEPNLPKKRVTLFEAEKNIMHTYLLPVMGQPIIIEENSMVQLHKGNFKEVFFQMNSSTNKYIFQIVAFKKRYIVMRLELVEALLRRNITGLMLHEIKCKEEKNER